MLWYDDNDNTNDGNYNIPCNANNHNILYNDATENNKTHNNNIIYNSHNSNNT